MPAAGRFGCLLGASSVRFLVLSSSSASSFPVPDSEGAGGGGRGKGRCGEWGEENEQPAAHQVTVPGLWGLFWGLLGDPLGLIGPVLNLKETSWGLLGTSGETAGDFGGWLPDLEICHGLRSIPAWFGVRVSGMLRGVSSDRSRGARGGAVSES